MDSLKGQILVLSRDAVRHFETLKQAVCVKLRSRLLIHTDPERAIGDLSNAEIQGSDAAIITHDRKDEVDGDKRLLGSVSILQTLGIGVIIVLGVSNRRLRKKLEEKAALVRENNLGDITEEGLTNDIQQALGIEEQPNGDAPQ